MYSKAHDKQFEYYTTENFTVFQFNIVEINIPSSGNNFSQTPINILPSIISFLKILGLVIEDRFGLGERARGGGGPRLATADMSVVVQKGLSFWCV